MTSRLGSAVYLYTKHCVESYSPKLSQKFEGGVCECHFGPYFGCSVRILPSRILADHPSFSGRQQILSASLRSLYLTNLFLAQLAGAVEYTKYISAEE